MARYLVTGGCGFIGSHLAEALVAGGHQVRILDNLSTGKRGNAPPEAELIIGDIIDRHTVDDCVAGTDGVFHLAAIASVDQSRVDWVGCHAVNLTGCVHILDAARRTAIPPQVVYASSAAIYGNSGSTPLTEAERPRPVNAYGADKLGCELHARVASLLHAVPTIGLRLFNVYGPRQDPSSPYSGVISIFLDRLGRRAPIEIFGDGQQVRDFIAVADVVQFFIAAMSAKDGLGEAFNVCTGLGTTILALAETLANMLGLAPDIRFAMARPGDIRTSIGDPTRCGQVIGLRARYSIRDGLALLVQGGDRTVG